MRVRAVRVRRNGAITMTTDTILCSYCGVKTGHLATEVFRKRPLCKYCADVYREWQKDAQEIEIEIKKEASDERD